MNPITDSLRQFIKENFLYGEDATFSENDSFLEMGLIDSTGVLELVTFVEDHFAVTIDDEELVPDNLDSIDRLVRFIETKRSQCQFQA